MAWSGELGYGVRAPERGDGGPVGALDHQGGAVTAEEADRVGYGGPPETRPHGGGH